LSGEGFSVPPDDLLIDTQPGRAKFPAVVSYLDPEDRKKVSRA
jgi:hypothetical protein